MKITIIRSRVFLATVSGAVLMAAGQCAKASEEWVLSEKSRSLPGEAGVVAQTFFSAAITKTEGTFPALYDSVLEKKNTVKGEFLVGKYRYRYKFPVGERGSKFSPLHDDYISEVLLDCKRGFSGTVSEIFLLNGKTTLEIVKPRQEILMMQMDTRGTTIGDLCRHAKQLGAW